MSTALVRRPTTGSSRGCSRFTNEVTADNAPAAIKNILTATAMREKLEKSLIKGSLSASVWATMTTSPPISGVNGARAVDVIPQIGSFRVSSGLPPNIRCINAITTDTRPAKMQTFRTVAVAYTNPGMIVVTEPPPTGGLIMRASRMMAARVADRNVPSVRVITTMAQILFVFTFVVIVDQLFPAVQPSCVLAKYSPANL